MEKKKTFSISQIDEMTWTGLAIIAATVLLLIMNLLSVYMGLGSPYISTPLFLFGGVIANMAFLLWGFLSESKTDRMVKVTFKEAGMRLSFGLLFGGLASASFVPDFTASLMPSTLVSVLIVPFLVFLLVLNAMLILSLYPKWQKKKEIRSLLLSGKTKEDMAVCKDCLTLLPGGDEDCWKCGSVRKEDL